MKCTVREVVQRPEIQAILFQKDLTSSQKTERIKKVLKDLRYPKTHQMEEKFEQKKKDLNLPSNLLLHHPPFFEGRGLKVEFQFETMEEYRSVLSSLSQLVDKEEFEEMIKNL